MNKVTEGLDTLVNLVKDNSDNISKLKQQMTELVSLLHSAKVLKKTNAEGEKKQQDNTADQTSTKELNGAMVIHSSELKGSEEKTADKSVSDDEDDEPIAKRLKVLIPTPKPLQSFIPDPLPHRDPSKGKEIATEKDPLKPLVPFLEQSGSDPNAINLHQIVDQKAAEEKTKKSLHRINVEAQKAQLAEYKAKRAKMLAEYNHYIHFRAHPGRITKINYKIDKVTRDATMRIERDNQPLSLTVMEKFGLKQLGFTKWIETQAGKLGISPPPELTEVGLTPAERKRKRTSEIVKEVFVTEHIHVDETQRNLTLPPGVVGKSRLVIREPEAGFFYFNANFDLVFQRESEFYKTSTVQLIRLLKHINQDSPEAKEMYKIIELEIESRNDVNRAQEIAKYRRPAECKASEGKRIPVECIASEEGNEDQLSAQHQLMIKGLADSIALASNLRDNQVRDIIKEVKEYLKTYSPAEMDIRWTRWWEVVAFRDMGLIGDLGF
ncbi:hypothetical protein Tco_1255395 [Tanacetum coccineum]